MSKALGRDLSTILDDIENSYKEIELENQSLKKEKNLEKNRIKIENFVKLLKEKYNLSVQNEGNNLIINVNSQKKLKKLKKIFNI